MLEPPKFWAGQQSLPVGALNAMAILLTKVLRAGPGIMLRKIGTNQYSIEATADYVTAGRSRAAVRHCPHVGALPELDWDGDLVPFITIDVFWDSTMSPNTGDNQIWTAHKPQTKYYPQQFLTDKSSTPTEGAAFPRP
jgi:hypothetical protein